MSQDIRTRLAELLGPVLQDLSQAEQPAFVALAERIAAGRYRSWAEQVKDAETRERLLACADREDEIASRVESVTAGAAEIQNRVQAAHPGVAQGYQDLFAGLDLAEQLAFQAQAERTGAATWRAYAKNAAPETAAIFSACAELEEASAEVLEAIVAASGVG